MARAEITLIGKPGCHLCDDARQVVTKVVSDLGHTEGAPEIVVGELSIFDDQTLYDEHVEDIPVILINGKVHTFWRVDPDRLRTAVLAVR
ncbi:glutaredoxin family protein [Subtercola lobariae]|uniref:Glutaredoxin family protein n=1 Tax=Subtercola lobariae TaxID=1588641 RepID=A0A917ETT1_9MICO|nr:glutaredoxin family protein [Subtercola lobariae]GGF11092.1 hypothetical protein GCM10011399_01120 [Subtercola lobariae]